MSSAQPCIHCHQVTGRPVMVASVEQNSGAGWAGYACPPCARHYRTAGDLAAALAGHRQVCSHCHLTGADCPTAAALREAHEHAAAAGAER
ncbi:hypothetical protein [Streptomyces aidingensis]|uniref:C2H2-type domain-containing protein n=1 Tax=Streptomyces aidingensis TaxID=910347 RepID=A0A1I1JCS0_9ACTN|nr:hypothetical protein [Streptomyces aidingensis]SFC43773.1 hypothetical protein SAMN05421773_103295 [Streptomyces aidingensis]